MPFPGRPASSRRRSIRSPDSGAEWRRCSRSSARRSSPPSPTSIPGNFATNIAAGAKFGYALLWVVLAANLMAMIVQSLSAKLGIATGQNLAEVCRDRFPRPVT